MSDTAIQSVLTHLDARQPLIEDWLKAFLRIPSVSADPASVMVMMPVTCTP